MTAASQTTRPPVPTNAPDQEAAGRLLVALYAARVELAHQLAIADRPTAAMVREVLTKGDELDAACELYRRRFYPRRAQVLVGLYAVMVASPTRRRVETVLDLLGEYEIAPGPAPANTTWGAR